MITDFVFPVRVRKLRVCKVCTAEKTLSEIQPKKRNVFSKPLHLSKNVAPSLLHVRTTENIAKSNNYCTDLLMFSIPKHKNKMEVHNEQYISMPGKPAESRKWQIRRKYRDITRIKTFVSQKQVQIKIPSGMQEMATCDIFTGDHTKVHFLSFYLKHVQQFL